MSRELEQLFASLTTPATPPALTQAVLLRVHRAERRRAQRRVWLFAASVLGAGGLTGVIGISTARLLNTTGFYYYVGLLMNRDLGLLAAWKALALSIIASIPVVEVGLLLAGLTACVWLGAQLYSASRQLVTLSYAPLT